MCWWQCMISTSRVIVEPWSTYRPIGSLIRLEAANHLNTIYIHLWHTTGWWAADSTDSTSNWCCKNSKKYHGSFRSLWQILAPATRSMLLSPPLWRVAEGASTDLNWSRWFQNWNWPGMAWLIPQKCSRYLPRADSSLFSSLMSVFWANVQKFNRMPHARRLLASWCPLGIA